MTSATLSRCCAWLRDKWPGQVKRDYKKQARNLVCGASQQGHHLWFLTSLISSDLRKAKPRVFPGTQKEEGNIPSMLCMHSWGVAEANKPNFSVWEKTSYQNMTKFGLQDKIITVPVLLTSWEAQFPSSPMSAEWSVMFPTQPHPMVQTCPRASPEVCSIKSAWSHGSYSALPCLCSQALLINVY